MSETSFVTFLQPFYRKPVTKTNRHSDIVSRFTFDWKQTHDARYTHLFYVKICWQERQKMYAAHQGSFRHEAVSSDHFHKFQFCAVWQWPGCRLLDHESITWNSHPLHESRPPANLINGFVVLIRSLHFTNASHEGLSVSLSLTHTKINYPDVFCLQGAKSIKRRDGGLWALQSLSFL